MDEELESVEEEPESVEEEPESVSCPVLASELATNSPFTNSLSSQITCRMSR